MEDPIEINRRNWDERAAIHARDATGFYGLERVRAGEDKLDAIAAGEIGDVSGKRVLHLQCHFGLDTLCLSRRGAVVTGLDFSPAAIAAARRLAAETGLEAAFVCGRVEEAPGLAPGPFDLVYATWGTICWLPDMQAWARTVAAVLAPGGEVYLADAHPAFLVMEEQDGRMVPTYDYRTPPDRPLAFTEATTYTGDPTVMAHQETREWIHPLSEVVGALLTAGMELTMLSEHDALPWQGLPMLVPGLEGMFRLPDGHPRLPLAYSLRARKRG